MIKYLCKFCGIDLGEIEKHVDYATQLGLDSLTPVERQSIITYKSNGDMVAKVICEYCQETLEKNPDLLLVSNPLQ